MKTFAREDLIIRESMRLPFHGGELWAIELDSLYEHTDLVVEKLRGDMEYARRPSTPSAVAVHLKNTAVSQELTALIAWELSTAGGAVRRAALIGLGFRARWKMRSALRQSGCVCTVAFFSDYERAKEWLIP